MNAAVERRRSPRISPSGDEAAVVHSGGRDILVRVRDFSTTGALLSLLDIPELETGADYGERVSLSMHLNQSVFQVPARVVRWAPGFVAVEFVATGQVSDKIAEKVRTIGIK